MLHLQAVAADGALVEDGEILFALEHGAEVAALLVKGDGLLHVVGQKRSLLARVPDEVGRVRRVGRGHALAVAHVAVLLDELVERAEVEGAQRAGRSAGGLHALGQTVDAHGALAHLAVGLIGGELGRAVGAGVVALAAAGALVLVHQHCAVLVLLVQGATLADRHAGGVLAVSAAEGQRVQAQVRERALLPLVDAHPLLGARLDLVPVLAGDAAGLAGVAAVHIEKESVLGHGSSFRVQSARRSQRRKLRPPWPRPPRRGRRLSGRGGRGRQRPPWRRGHRRARPRCRSPRRRRRPPSRPPPNRR